MTLRVVAAVVAAALVAAACADDGTSEPPPLVTAAPGTPAPAASDPPPDPPGSTVDVTTSAPAPPPVAAGLAQVDCPAELSRSDGRGVACGVATVPLDRASAGSATIEITLATLAGTDDEATTPVAVLQGGPGGASSDLARWFPVQPFTQVFVDQRGAGFVGTDLDCPEIVDVLPQVLAVPAAEGADLAIDAYADCADRLGADPLLDHTDSDAHAADVAAVMSGLGHTRWVVYGVSYGSTIGLELLRDPPAGLAGAVLDGVYPPELDADAALVSSATRALDELDQACAVHSVCRGFLADGSVRSTMERVMTELDTEPMTVTLSARDTGLSTSVDVVLDGGRVAEFAFLLLYQEGQLRHLPAVLGGLDQRDASSATWLARTGTRAQVQSQEANDEGTYFAVQCRDRLPFTDGTGASDDPFAAAIAIPVTLEEACAAWAQPPAPASAAEPVSGDLPTLLLSGNFDPITPPEYAEQVAERLAGSVVVEQAGRGHGIWFGDDCIADLVARFVAEPAGDLDTSCAATDVPVEWARP